MGKKIQMFKDNMILKNKKLNTRAKILGLILLFPLVATNIMDIIEIFGKQAFLSNDALYIFPNVNSRLIQELILNNISFIGIFIGIPLGFLLGYILTIVYLWFIKKFKKRNPIMFGLVRSESDLSSIKTLLFRAFYAGFLTMSILFIIIENNYLASLWWKDIDDFNVMMGDQRFGIYSETFLLPWLWLVLAITIALMVAIWSILDSGLISIKNINQFYKLKRVEQAGKLYDRIIKGYVGVSLLISWILWIMKLNTGIAVLPINTVVIILFFIIILEYFKPLSNKLIQNATKKVFPNVRIILVDIREVE